MRLPLALLPVVLEQHDRFSSAKRRGLRSACQEGANTAQGVLWRSHPNFSAAYAERELSPLQSGNGASKSVQVAMECPAICASKPAGNDGRGGQERQSNALSRQLFGATEPGKQTARQQIRPRQAAPVSFAEGNRGPFRRLPAASIGAKLQWDRYNVELSDGRRYQLS